MFGCFCCHSRKIFENMLRRWVSAVRNPRRSPEIARSFCSAAGGTGKEEAHYSSSKEIGNPISMFHILNEMRLFSLGQSGWWTVSRWQKFKRLEVGLSNGLRPHSFRYVLASRLARISSESRFSVSQQGQSWGWSQRVYGCSSAEG
jgi:hypothetical protein